MADEYIVAGGDMRFSAAAEYLAAHGKNTKLLYPCRHVNIEAYMEAGGISPADYLILPVPVTKDGVYLNAPAAEAPPKLSELFRLVKPGGTVFGGKVTGELKRKFAARNIYTEDYMDREELSVMNALATAEGAVMTALQKQDIMLHRQKVLIIGMGRIGKALIGILKGFGADIYDAARRPEHLAWADIMGCRPVKLYDTESGMLSHEFAAASEACTLIFNTVPSMILTENALVSVNRKALIIDLASAPGGTDIAAAERLGIQAVNLPGLPGKASADSAGCLIAETVLTMIAERRNYNV
ncbi:MAG: dipicolinate synthase subunit A [Oscillospiraceae bacterium]|nr:dipicolinate synthase subunit A [Oscillospiraceae bacterium]